MFSEAEKREYRAIRAPEGLRQRVLDMADTAAAAPVKRRSRRWMPTAVAACLVLTLLAAVLLPRADLAVTAGPVGGSADESGVAALARAAEPLTVPVTVTTRGETALAVSDGRLLRAETGEEVTGTDGAADLLWEIDAPHEEMRYTLTACRGDERVTLTLAFDTAEGRWTACAAEES